MTGFSLRLLLANSGEKKADQACEPVIRKISRRSSSSVDLMRCIRLLSRLQVSLSTQPSEFPIQLVYTYQQLPPVPTLYVVTPSTTVTAPPTAIPTSFLRFFGGYYAPQSEFVTPSPSPPKLMKELQAMWMINALEDL